MRPPLGLFADADDVDDAIKDRSALEFAGRDGASLYRLAFDFICVREAKAFGLARTHQAPVSGLLKSGHRVGSWWRSRMSLTSASVQKVMRAIFASLSLVWRMQSRANERSGLPFG